MEQRSDVEYRAEKLYKNSREKFGYLIREIVSNAIHATIIRENNENDSKYQPKVEVKINKNTSNIFIEVKDNGEGFTEHNRKYFTHLDTRNPQKDKLHFHPMGQGRLAIVYFSDKAIYSSVYKNENNSFRQKQFNYPETSLSLFDIEDFDEEISNKHDSETILKLHIDKQQTYNRANTFFTKYPDIGGIRIWFIENFFPFFMENENLQLSVEFNGDVLEINQAHIEKTVKCIHFNINFENDSDKSHVFKLWLMEKDGIPKSKNQIICFARHLRAELDEGKLEYEIDLQQAYDWFLTSEYFDDHVDQKGDKIEVPLEHIEKIQIDLTATLDNHFSAEITKNRTESINNFKKTKEKFPSLSVFMDSNKAILTNRVLKEADLVGNAIESKGKVEKNYWTSQKTEPEDIGKLINSSLHIYIDHRKRILKKLKELTQKFDSQGEKKNELEDDVHDLFLQRGESLRTAENINHLHNLWILDDKYTIFTEAKQAVSTRKGQEASDIYLWLDDPEQTKELLILELKSTTNAHNAGDKYESMIAQVKRYAGNFYKDPERVLNWNADPDKILYFGVILARKSDINKELNSNNSSGMHHKIPFLNSSYFFNDTFSIASSSSSAPLFMNIRIEMYSYEDIYQLASSRNEVFFKLLQREYHVEDES